MSETTQPSPPSLSDPAAASPATTDPTGTDRRVVMTTVNNTTGHTFDAVSNRAAQGGLREIQLGIEMAFDENAHRFESRAASEANALAEQKLPSPNEVGPISAELALRNDGQKLLEEHAASAYSTWQERINEAAAQVHSDVGTLLRNSGILARLVKTLKRIRKEIAQHVQDETHRVAASGFGFAQHLSDRAYWTIVLLLGLLDFVATVPVWGQLFSGTSAEGSWREAVAHSEKMGILGGLYRMLARITAVPEATLAALVVVVLLLAGCHLVGHALRNLKSLPTDSEDANVQHHLRAFPFGLKLGIPIIVAVLCSLFLARAIVEPGAARHLESARKELAAVDARLQASHDPRVISNLNLQHEELQALVQDRTGAHEYAETVTDLNWVLLILNAAVALMAILAAYSNKSVDEKTAPRLTDEYEALLKKRNDLTAEIKALRERQHELADRITRLHDRVQDLLKALPCADWMGKKARIIAAILRFRSENARLRGLNVGEIAAFRHEIVIAFDDPAKKYTLTVSPEFTQAYDRFCRTKYGRSVGAGTSQAPAPSMPAVVTPAVVMPAVVTPAVAMPGAVTPAPSTEASALNGALARGSWQGVADDTSRN